MDDKDKTRFAQIMTGLAEDCSSQLSSAGLLMRFEAMRQYTIEQIQRAVVRVMRGNVYTKMPTTGTIIQAIEGAEDDKLELCLMEIKSQIAKIGSYGTPVFTDETTKALVSGRFGWGNICGMTAKDFEFFAREFKAAYKSYSNATTLCIGVNSKITALLENIGNG